MQMMMPWDVKNTVKGVSDIEYMKAKYPDMEWMNYEFMKEQAKKPDDFQPDPNITIIISGDNDWLRNLVPEI